MLDITNSYSSYKNIAGIYMISMPVHILSNGSMHPTNYNYIGQTSHIDNRVCRHLDNFKNNNFASIPAMQLSFNQGNRPKIYLIQNLGTKPNDKTSLKNLDKQLKILETFYIHTLACNNKNNSGCFNHLKENILTLNALKKYIPCCELIRGDSNLNINTNKEAVQTIVKIPPYNQLELSADLNKDITKFKIITNQGNEYLFEVDRFMNLYLADRTIYVKERYSIKRGWFIAQNPRLTNLNQAELVLYGLDKKDVIGYPKLKEFKDGTTKWVPHKTTNISIFQSVMCLQLNKRLDPSFTLQSKARIVLGNNLLSNVVSRDLNVNYLDPFWI